MTSLTLVWEPAAADSDSCALPAPWGHESASLSDPITTSPPAMANEAVSAPKAMVAGTVARALELLQHRRHFKQLRDLFTDEALVVLQAWSRLPQWANCRLGSARASVLNPTAIEGCASLFTAERALMVTVRLERGRDQRWRCVRLDFVCSAGHLAMWGLAGGDLVAGHSRQPEAA